MTDGTMLTLTHEQFFNEKARDDHGRGWNVALDRLERLPRMTLDHRRRRLSDPACRLFDGLPHDSAAGGSCRAC